MESKPSDAGQFEFRLNSGISKHSSEYAATEKQELNTSIGPVLESKILKCDHVTEKEKSFDDLANETFDKILKNVATSDLLNCRRVNRRWSEISSRLVRGRDDITIHFKFIGDEFIQTIHHQHCEKLCNSYHRQGSKNLSDLVNHMQDPKQFPFTSYRFDELEPSNFGNRSMRDFLTDFGKEIRSLKICLVDSKESCELLPKLVFEEAPNLKILEIGVSLGHHASSENPAITHLLTKSVDQLHLPQLEALRVHVSLERYVKTIEAILIASPNLKSVTLPGTGFTEDVEMLLKTNKLHCVKEAYLIGQEKIEYWLKSGPLQLQHLNLRFFLWGVHRPKVGSIKTINQLFQSTKDSLLSFTTEPLGALRGLVLPKFEKLQKLILRPDVGSQMTRTPSYPPYLPPFDWAATFPNIKELDLTFYGLWQFDSTFQHLLTTPLPIETLRINADDGHDIADVMKFTPNVKTLVIVNDSIVWDGNMDDKVNFGDISRYLPKLENFGWELNTGTKDISRIPYMCEFDAKVTGLPVNLCTKLGKEFRDKSNLSADELAKYHSKRRGASILDLKGLKNFYVQLTVNDELSLYGDDSGSDYDSDAEMGPPKFDPECNAEISKVSKLLAFDLMPNLQFFSHTFNL